MLAAIGPALLDTLRHPEHAFVQMLAGALGQFVDGARADIEGVLGRYLFSTVDISSATPRSFTDNPALRPLNLSLAVAADILVGAVLLVASLRSIFEHSLRARYSLKVVLPRLLLALVLVHFSLPLMQMGIDLDNALSAVALHLGSELRVDGMPWSPVVSDAAVRHISVTQDIFHGVLAVVVVIALVILVLAYLLRHALLSILVVVAPVAGLLTVLPDTRGYARTWMRLFTVTVMMQPLQLLVLRVAVAIGDANGGGVVETLEALVTLFLMLKVPGALNTAAHLETKAETLGKHLARSMRRQALGHVGHHPPAHHPRAA